MRTTLDIDDDVLEAAKELARSQRKTAGQVLSALARRALMQGERSRPGQGPGGAVLKDGWYTLPSRGGIVTSELIERLLDEADLEDAGLRKRG
jgi:hypothetical protein